ncbi:hypothetical protein LWI28_005553 [Acer negundo]|uniref:RNase H type-1 domain-containing protein n=1 Tax=Acer negundo TaxID=4023 RepID=A0AAD5NWG4_ACENE|nr:hypothetical protein LWI28_005553 [Acer negundo]
MFLETIVISIQVPQSDIVVDFVMLSENKKRQDITFNVSEEKVAEIETQSDERDTDSDGRLKEDGYENHTNILSSSSGLELAQVLGLDFKGPSKKSLLNQIKSVAEEKDCSGLGLKVVDAPVIKLGPALNLISPIVVDDHIDEMAMVCSSQPIEILSLKNSVIRNWKRLARGKNVELNSIQQPSLFRNIQTVSIKGKKISKGVGTNSDGRSRLESKTNGQVGKLPNIEPNNSHRGQDGLINASEGKLLSVDKFGRVTLKEKTQTINAGILKEKEDKLLEQSDNQMNVDQAVTILGPSNGSVQAKVEFKPNPDNQMLVDQIKEFQSTIGWCISFLSDNNCRYESNFLPNSSDDSLAEVWPPPVLGSFKINCKAILDSMNRKIGIGIGIVIGNHEGLAISSESLFLDSGLSFLSTNAVAILYGLQFGKECGIRPLCVESDASAMVRLINDGNHWNSSYGNIVCDILGSMTELGISSRSSGRKGSNNIASLLARQALLRKRDVIWKMSVL